MALLAGVSAITVSRALKHPELVANETLERIRAAIARTGYVPNLMAGALASNRSGLVAALVPTIAGSVFLETIQALTDALDEAGSQLLLGQTGYGEQREDSLLSALIGRRPDGIVLTGIMHSSEGRKRLLASGIPVVETWDLTPTPIDMLVGFSHERVGNDVADYLYAKGYRRPAVLSADDYRAGQRIAGFQRRMASLGVADVPAFLTPAPTSLADGRAGLSWLFEHHMGIDAIFCSSDVLAHGVLTEAQARGIEVPRKLAVMGFGNLPFAPHIFPALSTVHIDGREIGRQAAQFILARNSGADTGHAVRDVGFQLRPRDSA